METFLDPVGGFWAAGCSILVSFEQTLLVESWIRSEGLSVTETVREGLDGRTKVVKY